MVDERDGQNGSTNGNGVHAPEPGAPSPTLPAQAVPQPAGVVRDERGRVVKGAAVLNPKGRPAGVPNRNTPFLRMLDRWKADPSLQKAIAKRLGIESDGKSFDQVSAEIALVQAAGGQNELLIEIFKRRFIAVTPESAGFVLNVNQTNQQNHTETYVGIADLLADEGARAGLADLAERFAARGIFAGDNGYGG